MSEIPPLPDAARTLALLRRVGHSAAETEQAAGLQAGADMTPEEVMTFVELVRRVNREEPSESDVAELDAALAAHPGLWRAAADLAARAIDIMIDQLGPSVGLRFSLRRGADELLASLAGGGASPLECTVAEQVTVCWVRLRVFEAWLAKATAEGEVPVVRFWEARVASAQHRYLAACESLARIRRLAVRTPQLLQINLAGQQVNIAGDHNRPCLPASDAQPGPSPDP
jgi:hypothetical protein